MSSGDYSSYEASQRSTLLCCKKINPCKAFDSVLVVFFHTALFEKYSACMHAALLVTCVTNFESLKVA